MKLDDYRTLGHSGLRVSPLCLGTMTFGEDWGWGCDETQSIRLINDYREVGGNFIDTANIYTKGHSEEIVGKALADKAVRDATVLATKFCGNMYRGDPNGGGASRLSIKRALHDSLRRLRTDRIDLYWMHFYDRFTPMEETLRALDDLVRAGDILYVGFSDVPAWQASRAQTIAQQYGWSPVIALQVEYSLMQRTIEHELVPMADAMGMGLTPWSPLRGGILSGKYTRENAQSINPGRGAGIINRLTEETFVLLDVLEAVAKEVNTGMAQVALAWLLHQPQVISPIIGVRTDEQLAQNLAACEVELTAEQLARLDEASKPADMFPTQFLENANLVMHNGTSINGVRLDEWPLSPEGAEDRW